MIIHFLLGMLVGAGIVGSSVQRTISVARGNLLQASFTANANSIFYFFSVYYVAKGNISAYVGTCVGSWLIVMYMTHRNRRKNDKKHLS